MRKKTVEICCTNKKKGKLKSCSKFEVKKRRSQVVDFTH